LTGVLIGEEEALGEEVLDEGGLGVGGRLRLPDESVVGDEVVPAAGVLVLGVGVVGGGGCVVVVVVEPPADVGAAPEA
jgi:hypothetical protein